MFCFLFGFKEYHFDAFNWAFRDSSVKNFKHISIIQMVDYMHLEDIVVKSPPINVDDSFQYVNCIVWISLRIFLHACYFRWFTVWSLSNYCLEWKCFGPPTILSLKPHELSKHGIPNCFLTTWSSVTQFEPRNFWHFGNCDW